jgi:zinc/manganese transport system permease protein
VFSSLIVPALATRFGTTKRRLFIAYTIGTIGYALGLALSAVFDLPSGAIVVCTLAVVGVLYAVLSPSRARETSS